MRNPLGMGIMHFGDGAVVERDSTTCAHCQKVTFVKPFQDPTDLGGFCRQCMKNICSRCADGGTCTPWEKQMEIREAHDSLIKAVRG